MKANVIISFASGILLSAGISGYFYFTESSSSKTNAATREVPTEDEMRETLSASGYVVLTDGELEQRLLAVVSEQEGEKETTETEEPVKEETIVYRTIVNVASGMTSIDVGHALVQGKVIDNAHAFFKEVEKRGLSNKLKPGTFELDSNMTMDEVIAEIF